ncbi:MAG: hypothetical protein ACRDOH_27425, partial [Streptosporangiaceae bacterium]
MSEYQYYDFLALDKPLTDEQRAELRKLSSRADITATRFVNLTFRTSRLRFGPHSLQPGSTWSAEGRCWVAAWRSRISPASAD